MTYKENGKVVTKVSIAVDNPFGKKDDQGRKQADWFDLVFFDKIGETAGEYIKKGKQVAVSGRLSIEKYDDRDGVKRTAVKVIVQHLTLLGGKKEEEE